MTHTLQNFYETTLASGIDADDVEVVVNTAPTPTSGYLIIEPDSSTNREIIYYSSKSGTTLTLPSVEAGRGQGGTSAAAHDAGATVIMSIIKEHYDALKDGTGFSVAWQSWTPEFGGSGSLTFTSGSPTARYFVFGKLCFINLYAAGTTGGSTSTIITFTLPVAAVSGQHTLSAGTADVSTAAGVAWISEPTVCSVKKGDGSNWGLGASRVIRVSGFYEIA